MPTKTSISIPDWIFKKLEAQRGDVNRSEFISEMIAKGLQQRDMKEEIADLARQAVQRETAAAVRSE